MCSNDFCLFRLCPTDAHDTDIFGKPGRSGGEFAGRSAFEARRVRGPFGLGQSADGTPEETSRFSGLSGVRDALGERRIARSGHRADD